MRVLIFSVAGIAAVVVALAVWWVGRDVEAELAKVESRRSEAAAKIGIRRLFAENGEYTIFDVALGNRSADGSRDFRGFLEREGKASPAYGRLRAICTTGLDNPECWEIAYLEANGKPLGFGNADTSLEITSADIVNDAAISGDPSLDSEGANGDGSEPASSVETPETDDPIPPEPTLAVDGATPALAVAPVLNSEPQPTHKVVPSAANARAGPTLDAQVLAVLPKDTSLALQETEGNWGKFQVLGGDRAGQDRTGETVWVSLSIVTKIEP